MAATETAQYNRWVMRRIVTLRIAIADLVEVIEFLTSTMSEPEDPVQLTLPFEDAA